MAIHPTSQLDKDFEARIAYEMSLPDQIVFDSTQELRVPNVYAHLPKGVDPRDQIPGMPPKQFLPDDYFSQHSQVSLKERAIILIRAHSYATAAGVIALVGVLYAAYGR